ncbi:UPF0102 protein [Bacteroidia bacterium]|nr:UPF0102 protein [Bacteroidia bacterium]
MNSYYKGLFAEWYARQYLRLRGYQIIATRYVTGQKTGRAEIDLIAKYKNVLVFVEIKRRASIEAGLEAVTYGQKIRLRRSAENYIRRKQWLGPARFDVIVVLPKLKIKHFKRVF